MKTLPEYKIVLSDSVPQGATRLPVQPTPVTLDPGDVLIFDGYPTIAAIVTNEAKAGEKEVFCKPTIAAIPQFCTAYICAGFGREIDS